jgi:transcriptional regulator with XRE-family HTH domain
MKSIYILLCAILILGCSQKSDHELLELVRASGVSSSTLDGIEAGIIAAGKPPFEDRVKLEVALNSHYEKKILERYSGDQLEQVKHLLAIPAFRKMSELMLSANVDVNQARDIIDELNKNDLLELYKEWNEFNLEVVDEFQDEIILQIVKDGLF